MRVSDLGKRPFSDFDDLGVATSENITAISSRGYHTVKDEYRASWDMGVLLAQIVDCGAGG